MDEPARTRERSGVRRRRRALAEVARGFPGAAGRARRNNSPTGRLREAAATQQGATAARRSRNRIRARAPAARAGDPWTPAGLFNGMIIPLLPYALRGVLWYQGESNVRSARRIPRAVRRADFAGGAAHFGQGEIPFYWVNLANFAAPRRSDRPGVCVSARGADQDTHAAQHRPGARHRHRRAEEHHPRQAGSRPPAGAPRENRDSRYHRR